MDLFELIKKSRQERLSKLSEKEKEVYDSFRSLSNKEMNNILDLLAISPIIRDIPKSDNQVPIEELVELQNLLVETTLKFKKEKNINVDSLFFNVTGLSSTNETTWIPSIDSGLTLEEVTDEGYKVIGESF